MNLADFARRIARKGTKMLTRPLMQEEREKKRKTADHVDRNLGEKTPHMAIRFWWLWQSNVIHPS